MRIGSFLGSPKFHHRGFYYPVHRPTLEVLERRHRRHKEDPVRMHHRFSRRLLARTLAAIAVSTGLSSALALKVDMYAIGNWSGGNCAPGDTDTDRGSWPGMAAAWYDWMGIMGNTKTGKFVDGNMTVQRFCDPSFNAGCQDFAWVDWPDAAIIAAHGFDAGNRWG